MKSIITTLFILFTTAFSFSQTEQFPCKTDEMHRELLEQHPEYRQGIINAHNRLKEDTKNFIQKPTSKSNATYVIPVVFHIIHNYGPENISDAQVHDALKQVNIQYRKQNPDTNDILAPFKSLAADIEIEFRLAQLDPDGNCTSGITRTVSSLTSPGNHDVKALIHWPQNKYLNVYVCAQAAGLAGHSMMPEAADTIPEWDGIVMQHAYLGTIGTSEYFRRTVLSHEIGHYLNLYHIWGGNNVPDYYYLPVASPGNCAFDDEVADTPNTIGWETCNLAGSTCGELDNVQNYMDYSYCARMFTEGQKTRMHACLNSSVANRNNLWQEANLIATGTDDGTFILCAAKFESTKRVVCVGDTISFYDLSYHGVQSREWNFFGGTATSITDSSTKVAYSASGNYDVKLKVMSGTEEREITLPNYVTVLPETSLPSFYRETFENTSSIHCEVIDNATPFNWQLNSSVGFNSNNSYSVNNFAIESPIISEFYLHPVDLAGLTSAVVSFDFSYAQRATSNVDLLQVYVSKDCGKTWDLRKTLSGTTSLKTVTSPVTTSFTPTSMNEWKNTQATLNASHLIDHLLVRFKFTSAGGNNVYVDNIQVGDPNKLSLLHAQKNNLTIYPNPAKNYIQIQANDEEIQSFQLINTEGKIILEETAIFSNEHQINTASFAPGTYFINVLTDRGIYRQIQVIAK